jgi:hypothetical protein
MPEEMKTLVEVLNDLRKQGYKCDFLLEDGIMHCKNTDKKFSADKLTVEKSYRFEGDSNPDDMSVLYALISSNGTKGIIINAYGTYEDSEIGEFMKKVKMK